MKKLLFIILIIICFSCERQEHSDWQCINTVVYSLPGYIPDSISYVNFYPDRTHEEILFILKSQTYTGTQEHNGLKVNVESRCSCAKTICP
jgi:hypothetical protein